jgi:(1->4)-alpha-D-glucan 1-alpha-D-glucosylmutase
LNRLEGIFVDPDGEKPLTELYARFTGLPQSFAEVARDAKHLVMQTSLDADVRRLVRCLSRECKETRWFDVPGHALRSVVTEYLAELPVYRTYVRAGRGGCAARDAAVVRPTKTQVARRLPDLDPAFLDFVASRLEGEGADGPGEFALLLQQTSGAVMAKGVEDTAFYRYMRFIALNEVGGDPSAFGCSVERFHADNLGVCARWPETLVATATHDTKRGEDVRARLAVLSEIPGEWARRVDHWHELTRVHRDPRVDANDEYAFYQTLVGAFPLSEARAVGYVQKAIREAKRHTSWTDPDAAYEAAVTGFVKGMLADAACMRDVGEFVTRRLLARGRVVSLAKKLVALTVPGVPDVYQGTELWDLSLVDPDNRRPVDYDERRKLLASCRRLAAEEIWAGFGSALGESGLPKMRVVQAALTVRARHPRAFGPGGTYTPLEGAGDRGSNVVSYARGEDVVVIVPRLVSRLEGGFGNTTVPLPEGRFTNEFTGDTVEGVAHVGTVLQRFPVALLTRAQ